LGVTGGNFSANTAISNGGGIFNQTGGTASVSGSTFTSNATTAGDGGGLYNDVSGSVSVIRTTFNANSAASLGGGIYNPDGASASVSGSTFTANSVGVNGGGGGIYTRGKLSPEPTKKYNTFSKNVPNDVGSTPLPRGPVPHTVRLRRPAPTPPRKSFHAKPVVLHKHLGSRLIDPSRVGRDRTASDNHKI
jgi:predicted outer membrane repeat protein